jgi:hypothetical protein
MSILTYIQELLDENDLPNALLEASDDVPYERLVVALESPDPQQEHLLEIMAYPQFIEGAFTKEKLPDSYYLIQFQCILSIKVSPETFNQVASCLHFFNRLMHCPGFELDELNDQILYRYVWFIKNTGIDAFLLKQVVGNIQLCFNLFNPYIREIAEGKYTLEDILEQVIRLAERISTKNSSS